MITALADKYAGFRLTGDAFSTFTDDVLAHLPNSVARQAVIDSVAYLAGEMLNRDMLSRLVCRLTGNLPRLSRHLSALPWTFQPYPEWVPAQIVAIRLQLSPKGKIGYMVSFLVRAGCPAGLTIRSFWSKKFFYVMAPTLGFTKRRPSVRQVGYLPRTMRHPRETVTLQLLLLIDPVKSYIDPVFTQMAVPPSLKSSNQEQMGFRDRMDAAHACPKGYTLAQVLCHQCPVGFEECRAGCHRKRFEFQHCATCGGRAAFDPELQSDKCIECFELSVLRREG